MVALALAAGAAFAEEPEPPARAVTPEPSERFDVRVWAGVGLGSVGLLGRLALSLDVWPLEHVGFGLVGAYAEQEQVLADHLGYLLLAPTIALRSGTGPHGWYGSLGIGTANATYESAGSWLCLDSCSTPPPRNATSAAVTASVGYVRRLGALELGAALTLDLLQTGDDGQWDGGLAGGLLLGLAPF